MITCRTLLGKRNLEFSVNCLKSCVDNCLQSVTLEIFEDGSLNEQSCTYIKKEIAASVIVYKHQRDNTLNKVLEGYPLSKIFRAANVFGYKIFDVMLYDYKPFFYVDSDIIFYRKFSFPETGSYAIFMKDAESAYSFSNRKIFNSRHRLVPAVNAGFYYFPAAQFDLNLIEQVLAKDYIRNMYGHSWAEQTLFAFLAAKYKACYFNPAQIVMASPVIKINKELIAIHFSKPYRNKTEDIAKKVADLNIEDKDTQITLTGIKKRLHFLPYLAIKYYNKVLRNHPFKR